MGLPSIDLNVVNRLLNWNPNRRDRVFSRQQLCYPTSESVETASHQTYRNFRDPQSIWSVTLRNAKFQAEHSARLLAGFPQGRHILESEDPGEYGRDPQYWLARSAFYNKLVMEEDSRNNRSPTIELVDPELYRSPLERAKTRTENAVRHLARFPAGKALLAGDYLDASATNPESRMFLLHLFSQNSPLV